MSNIEQNICEAVDIIVNRALSQAQFDKTIKATIVNLVDSKTGKYKVRYQDDLIYAYAGTADMDFNTGDEVYILVPQGNFSGDKTILGTTKKIGGAAGDEYVLPENERYEIVGNNIFTEGTTFRLSSYDSYQTRVQTKITPGQYDAKTGEWGAGTTVEPYKTGAAPETFNIDAAAFSHYIKMADYLVLSAKIATNLPENQQYQGNYGFEVCLRFSTAEEGVFEDKIYRIDVNNIQGFPWGLGVDGIQQYFYFDIPSDKFVSIQSVQIFAENFPAEPEDGEAYDWDIWIKDLSMTAANRISDDDLDSYFVRLVTKNGSNFTRTNTSDKTIEAFVYEKSKNITTNSKLKYYWFYQRADVTTSHPNYCSYGGEGWYCLNEIVEVKDEKDENVIRKTWQPATNTWIVKKEDIITENKIYKCVVLYDNTVIEKQVVFTRDDVEWSIALATSTGETTFYRDEGSTQINCTIYDNLEPYLDHEKCTFKWMTINYLNSATLNESQTRTLDVKISSITYSSTYLCSAFIDGEYIGTDSITLTNTGEDLNLPLYELMMINNSQLFKYDEDGISPTSTAQENPETTLPLLLSIFDNKRGVQLDIGNGAAASVTIYIPNHHTLISPIGNKLRTEGEYDVYSYSSTGFVFDIKDKYNPSYKNNTIKVIAVYNKITLVGYTNFTFIKEGEDGTNGTRYVCRIVPNLKTGDNSYREWVTWTNNEDGSRSYNFEPDSESNPFRAVLLDGNTEVENISTAWSALFRKYTSSIQENSLIEASSPKPGYLGVSSDGAPPASVLQAEVVYDENTYYASLPIVDIRRESFNYNFEVKGGFHDVVYKADGTNPQYNNSEPFSIVVTDLDGNEVIDVVYEWSEMGQIYDTRDGVSKWYEAKLLKQDYNSTTTDKNFLVKPASKYDGLCLSTGVQCVISKNSNELATVFIPIHFYLNRFGHAAINGWNGNDIVTDNKSGIILSPQVGAGEKDSNNRFTGLVMGTIKDSDNKKKTGLVGYGKGVESFFINAQDGSASFGAKGKGQILIKPNTLDSQGQVISGDAIIEGGEYSTTNKTGLQINLSQPSIKYGSGKFEVDKDGILTAHGAKIYGSFDNQGDADSHFRVRMGAGSINFSGGSANISGNGLDINFNTGRLSFNGGEEDTSSFTGYIQPSGFYFGSEYIENSDGSKKGGSIKYDDGTLTISGTFNAETGRIGGWHIADKELYSSGKVIRLCSGDAETDPDNPIPAFITVDGDKAEISSLGDGEKAALRKGGLYLYSNAISPDNDNWKPGEWDGAIYTNSKYDDALTFVTQGTKPIYFFGNNLEGAKDSLVMRIQPGLTADSKYVRIGYSGSADETMTTLYPNKISVKDIDILAPLDTKAKTVAGAINEIYPGGPVNIQHAIAATSAEWDKINFTYEVVLNTKGGLIGYESPKSAVVADNVLITNYPETLMRPNAEGLYTPAQLQKTYPSISFFPSISLNFFFKDGHEIRKGKGIVCNLINQTPSTSDVIINEFWKRQTTIDYQVTYLAEDGEDFVPTVGNFNYTFCDYGVYDSEGLPVERGTWDTEGRNSLCFLRWESLHSHQEGNEYSIGYGYLQCSVINLVWNTDIRAVTITPGVQELSYKSSLAGHKDYYDRDLIYIPFQSQAEYEAAINLISVDQKLYEIKQNKSTSS